MLVIKLQSIVSVGKTYWITEHTHLFKHAKILNGILKIICDFSNF